MKGAGLGSHKKGTNGAYSDAKKVSSAVTIKNYNGTTAPAKPSSGEIYGQGSGYNRQQGKTYNK